MMISNKQLYISLQVARQNIRNIFNIRQTYGFLINIHFDKTINIGSGSIDVNVPHIKIYIGGKKRNTQEVLFSDDLEEIPSNTNITFQEYTEVLIGAYHERQHLQKEFDYLTHRDKKTLQMALMEYSVKGNKNYYDTTYWQNCCEIDAEKQGIINTYQHLARLTGDKKLAESLVVNCIKATQERLKSKNLPYFIENTRNTPASISWGCKGFSFEIS